jgi:hypothetical protein
MRLGALEILILVAGSAVAVIVLLVVMRSPPDGE